ncbi:hypothetical protein J2X44_002755 [Sphingopyxis sp. BE259]|nr:hypothetical protein [Sphingopyxis sp. BE122]MDR7228219.1 hypothetical protein [Sphingopyxis sp. BE259]
MISIELLRAAPAIRKTRFASEVAQFSAVFNIGRCSC